MGIPEEFLIHEATLSENHSKLQLCCAWQFCVVQLAAGESYFGNSFSVTTLFCKGSILLDGDGSQA